jgi:phospholipid N-methyltransferase
MDKSVKFLKNAIKGEKVGAVSRSSKFVIKKVLENIKKEKIESILEFGPGDGVLTIELLKKLTADGKIFVVELDPNFVEELRRIKDKRLVVIEGKMEDIVEHPKKFGIESVDIIVSSIPFTFIKKEDREDVVKKSKKILVEGGEFIIFHQYSLLMKKILLKNFKNVDYFFEPRNFLPCFVMVGEK